MEREETIDVCMEVLAGRSEIISAFLYGSLVSGHLRPESDIDIAVIVDGELSGEQVLSLQAKLALAVGRDVNLVEIGPRVSLILRNEISRKGVMLFTKDRDRSDEFLIRAPLLYEDFMFSLQSLEEKYMERKLEI